MDTTEPQGAGGSPKAGWVLLGAALLLAAGSIGYNVYEGSGGAPAAPAVAEGEPSIEQLRAAAEASSGDARPWSDLAFAYFSREEYAAAAEAYARAVALAPDEAVLHSALGEALVMASPRDPLPPEALAAFEKALALDPQDPRARYFLAVKKDIDKDHEGAIVAWLDLLADTPPGAPWEADLVRTIEQVGRMNDIEVGSRIARVQEARAPMLAQAPFGAGAASDVRGPSAAEVAAAGAMTPSQQREMAQGMVAQLEARLQQNPGNLDGWVMLMRSRMTLGEPAKAKAALEAAVKANPQEAAELRRQAQALGIG